FFSKISPLAIAISSIKASLHSSTQLLTAVKTSVTSILPLSSKSKNFKDDGIIETEEVGGMYVIGDVTIDVTIEVSEEVSGVIGVVDIGVVVCSEVEVSVEAVETGVLEQPEVLKSQAISQLKVPLA
ncbi:unnamed protein product, partial [marine sediment metagenome]